MNLTANYLKGSVAPSNMVGSKPVPPIETKRNRKYKRVQTFSRVTFNSGRTFLRWFLF